MEFTTLENLFIAIMTPLSIGFVCSIAGALYYEMIRLLINGE